VLTPDKIRISNAYLQRANVWRDLGVMARTVIALFELLWLPESNEPVSAPSVVDPVAINFPEPLRKQTVQTF
jgi:hypothetical protein